MAFDRARSGTTTRYRCATCGSLGRAGVGSYYICEAMRLPDPRGELQALPFHAVRPNDEFVYRFGTPDTVRDAERVRRWLSPVPVEQPHRYAITPCPAWRAA